jgi:hypothetical protein
MGGRHYKLVGAKDPNKSTTFHLSIMNTPPIKTIGDKKLTTRYKALFCMRESPDGRFFGETIQLEFIIRPELKDIDKYMLFFYMKEEEDEGQLEDPQTPAGPINEYLPVSLERQAELPEEAFADDPP